MAAPPPPDPEAIGREFRIAGRLSRVAPHGSGHINDTYAADYEDDGRIERVVFQRINPRVFRDPVALMGNVERVLAHLGRKLAPLGPAEASRRALALIPARDGRAFVRDAEGAVWRTYRRIDGARTVNVPDSPRQAYEAAKSFATFQRLLADLPAPRLDETIPGFHDTPARLEALREAAETDVLGRTAAVGEEIEACLSRERLAMALPLGLAQGAIPERIVHNDTKINNVLLDEATGEGLCVIDLDTVMPGLSAHDFGDLVRSAANPLPEDAPDASGLDADLGMIEAIAAGWTEGLGEEMLPEERDALVPGAQAMTLECAARFLTDYLEGDLYFRVRRAGHNLDRCRTQLALLRSLEQREEEIRRIIAAAGGGAR